MTVAFAMPEPDPFELAIDPRPCERCGLTIDRHQMVDAGDWPEFYCLDHELEPEYAVIAAIVRQMELDDPRDRWKHTGEAPPAPAIEPPPVRPAYRTPQATVDAFKYVLSLENPDYLARWLRNHPGDAAAFRKILDGGK